MVLTYQEHLFEGALNSIRKDVEKKLKELGLGNPDTISDDDALDFFKAVVGVHDGDIDKVKDKDLSESLVFFPLNENEIVELLGEIGEVMGTSAALQFVLGKIGNRFGAKSNITEIGKKLNNFLQWVTAASGVQAQLIEKAFAKIAKIFGASGINQKVVGKTGLILCLLVLLICSIMVFPAIGSGGFAMVMAVIASVAKLREIIKLVTEVWKLTHNPTKADKEEYPDFFEMMERLMHKNHDVALK